MRLLQAIFYSVCAVNLVFVVCEVGQRFSNAFEELDVLISQTNWYLFPYKVQRMLPMIIVNAQQPIGIKCFGSVFCERGTFQQVWLCNELRNEPYVLLTRKYVDLL